MCLSQIPADPVKAETYEDGILRARERMQRIQDEKASEHQEKMEEVIHIILFLCFDSMMYEIHMCGG